MRKDPRQFGSFDGLDNRRDMLQLFRRLGSDARADRLRGDIIARLVRLSDQCFANLPFNIEPCDAVAAYFAFVAVTGCLGVEIERAATEVENFVRGKETEIGVLLG